MPNTTLYPKKLVDRNKWHDYRHGIWGNSFTWSWVRPWHQLEGVLVHHTVTKHEATADDIALLHKARGWGGIGYHFVITKDGVVHYVGDLATARAHVKNKNERFIGISMVGDFTKHLPSDEQIKSIHDLCHYLFFETPSIPQLNSWNQLKGHKDEQATACPGTSYPIDMRDRIINRIPYTPEPDPTPEPPSTDWEQKYRDEVKAHQATKDEYKRYKDGEQRRIDEATKPLNARIDEAIRVLNS